MVCLLFRLFLLFVGNFFWGKLDGDSGFAVFFG